MPAPPSTPSLSAAHAYPPSPSLCRQPVLRSAPAKDAALDSMPRLRLLVILNHADLPPLARDSLVAAGVVPPLVALLGRWESFKVAGPGGAGGAPGGEPVLLALELMWGIAVLAERSGPARRQLRDAGAVPLLRALAADPALRPRACSSGALVVSLCGDALRYLGA